MFAFRGKAQDTDLTTKANNEIAALQKNVGQILKAGLSKLASEAAKKVTIPELQDKLCLLANTFASLEDRIRPLKNKLNLITKQELKEVIEIISKSDLIPSILHPSKLDLAAIGRALIKDKKTQKAGNTFLKIWRNISELETQGRPLLEKVELLAVGRPVTKEDFDKAAEALDQLDFSGAKLKEELARFQNISQQKSKELMEEGISLGNNMSVALSASAKRHAEKLETLKTEADKLAELVEEFQKSEKPTRQAIHQEYLKLKAGVQKFLRNFTASYDIVIDEVNVGNKTEIRKRLITHGNHFPGHNPLKRYASQLLSFDQALGILPKEGSNPSNNHSSTNSSNESLSSRFLDRAKNLLQPLSALFSRSHSDPEKATQILPQEPKLAEIEGSAIDSKEKVKTDEEILAMWRESIAEDPDSMATIKPLSFPPETNQRLDELINRLPIRTLSTDDPKIAEELNIPLLVKETQTSNGFANDTIVLNGTFQLSSPSSIALLDEEDPDDQNTPIQGYDFGKGDDWREEQQPIDRSQENLQEDHSEALPPSEPPQIPEPPATNEEVVSPVNITEPEANFAVDLEPQTTDELNSNEPPQEEITPEPPITAGTETPLEEIEEPEVIAVNLKPDELPIKEQQTAAPEIASIDVVEQPLPQTYEVKTRLEKTSTRPRKKTQSIEEGAVNFANSTRLRELSLEDQFIALEARLTSLHTSEAKLVNETESEDPLVAQRQESALQDLEQLENEQQSIFRKIRETFQGKTLNVTDQLAKNAKSIIAAGLPDFEDLTKYFSFKTLKGNILGLFEGQTLIPKTDRFGKNYQLLSVSENTTLRFYDDRKIVLKVNDTHLVIRDLRNGRAHIETFKAGARQDDKSGKLANYEIEKLVNRLIKGRDLSVLQKAKKHSDQPSTVYIPTPDIEERLNKGLPVFDEITTPSLTT